MSSSNCCFLTCLQVSQEAGQVVWYSHLFQNFPQFIVIQTVEGFGVINKSEIDVFLELSWFFDDPADIGNLISGSSAFSKTSLNIWRYPTSEVRETQKDGTCCERASEGRNTKTIITENQPIWSQDHSHV